MNTPNIEKVDRTDLRTWNGDVGYYHVTPAKGARIEGTFAVSMTSHKVGDKYKGTEREAPAVVVDLTPSHRDADGNTVYRDGFAVQESLTINGRENAGTLGGALMWVNFYPDGEGYAYGDPFTIDGETGHLWTEYHGSYNTFTDAGRKLVDAAATAIAIDFMTTERWLRYLYAGKLTTVKRLREAVTDAERAAQTAVTELAALRAHAGKAGLSFGECGHLVGVDVVSDCEGCAR